MIDYSLYGFTYAGSCNCDGIQTEKYKKDIWVLKHRRKHGTFKFKKNGVSVTQWLSEQQAEDYIKHEICGHLKSAG